MRTMRIDAAQLIATVMNGMKPISRTRRSSLCVNFPVTE